MASIPTQLLKKAISVFLLISYCKSPSAQVQQKRVYEISTEKLDSLNRQIINVTEDSFKLSLNFPQADSFGLKKAVMYINDKNAQDITGQLNSMVFTITDFNTITLELQVARKTYTKVDSLEMDSVTEAGTKKTYLLKVGELSTFLKDKKLTGYSVTRIKISSPATEVKFEEHLTIYKIVFINAIDVEGRSLRNSNIIIGALIKTLAGARPKDELVDLFVKLNYGRQKRTFSLLGADAGIGSVDESDSTGLFRINEAVANFNYALYRKRPFGIIKKGEQKQKITAAKAVSTNDDNHAIERDLTQKFVEFNDSTRKLNTLHFDSILKRTAFLGAGLKVFNSVPYIGAHIGSIEINGPLFGSYIFTGYYYSPYLQKITTRDSLHFQSFRHNIYIEAGVNAFGSRVPNVLKTLKLKFALMLPISKGDSFRPETKDVLSRLAIEVPLGTVFRF